MINAYEMEHTSLNEYLLKRIARLLSHESDKHLIVLVAYNLYLYCSNTTVILTICIVLNISCDIIFCKMVHLVIIISISKVFQVPNKPMGFLPPS